MYINVSLNIPYPQQTVYQYTYIWSPSGHHNGDKETIDNIIISRLHEFQLFSVVMYRDSVHSDQHSHSHSSKIFIMVGKLCVYECQSQYILPPTNCLSVYIHMVS